MIKLLAIDMDGTCLDQRSRMTDRTLDVLRKAAKAGDYGCSVYGTKFRVYSAQAGGRCAKGEQNRRMTKKIKDLFRYVITSNGAMVTDVKENEDIVQGSDKKMKMRFRSFPTAEKEKIRHCGACKTPLFLLRESFFTSAGRIVYGKDAAAVLLREKHGRDSFKK